MRLEVPEMVRYGGYREGVAIRSEDIDKWVISGEPKKAMLIGSSKKGKRIENGKEYWIMSDVEKAYEEANETINKAQLAYKKTLEEFRSRIGNDLKSIGSSADKTVKEYEKIRSAYVGTINLLTSDDMEKTIVNAERLANALKTIGEVKSAEVSFKLMDQES